MSCDFAAFDTGEASCLTATVPSKLPFRLEETETVRVGLVRFCEGGVELMFFWLSVCSASMPRPFPETARVLLAPSCRFVCCDVDEPNDLGLGIRLLETLPVELWIVGAGEEPGCEIQSSDRSSSQSVIVARRAGRRSRWTWDYCLQVWRRDIQLLSRVGRLGHGVLAV